MNYWPGTNIPKSNGNAFTSWKNGEPSRITGTKEWKCSQSAVLVATNAGTEKQRSFTIYSKARREK